MQRLENIIVNVRAFRRIAQSHQTLQMENDAVPVGILERHAIVEAPAARTGGVEGPQLHQRLRGCVGAAGDLPQRSLEHVVRGAGMRKRRIGQVKTVGEIARVIKPVRCVGPTDAIVAGDRPGVAIHISILRDVNIGIFPDAVHIGG